MKHLIFSVVLLLITGITHADIFVASNVLTIDDENGQSTNDLFLNGDKVKFNGSTFCDFPTTNEGRYNRDITKTWRPGFGHLIQVTRDSNNVCTKVFYLFESYKVNNTPGSTLPNDTGNRIHFPYSYTGGSVEPASNFFRFTFQYQGTNLVVAFRINADGTDLACDITPGSLTWKTWLDALNEFNRSAVLDYNKSNCNANIIVDTSTM